MKVISNRTWRGLNYEIADSIKQWLIKNGGSEDKTIKNENECWRIRYSDVTITFYKKGSLYITDSNDGALNEAHNFIDSLVGSKFVLPTKEILIGFDETGKGEVLGHLILAGVLIPKEIFGELEKVIGVADTKIKHSVTYWDEIFRKIDYFESKGLEFVVEKIPPWHFDKYNINKLLDITYQKILALFTHRVSLDNTRIVFDDYGIGKSLERYLNSLRQKGCEIIKTTGADDKYLESRVASLLSKREQQKVLEAITKNSEFQISGKPIGSGNAGDPQTLEWLKAWHDLKKEWPWFIKKSFKTIRTIMGITQEPKKLSPPINDHLLSQEFREKFASGELNIESLSIVCQNCGNVSKAIKLIPREKKIIPICVHCKQELKDVNFTLRYYCGRILPDTSVIARGFISKNLESSRLFEGFNFLLHPTVRKEADNSGGKKEFERIGHFASIGRIRLEEIGSILDPSSLNNLSRDESILIGARDNSAILLTADNQMKGIAQAKKIFTIEI